MIAVFLFYSYSAVTKSRLAFSKVFRHCNVIVYDGSDWVMSELNHSGIKTRVIKIGDVDVFLPLLKTIKHISAIITVWINNRKNVTWKPYFVRSCNEVSRYLTGVDTGLCFNPKHFYHRLLKLNGKRNYRILSQWRTA